MMLGVFMFSGACRVQFSLFSSLAPAIVALALQHLTIELRIKYMLIELKPTKLDPRTSSTVIIGHLYHGINAGHSQPASSYSLAVTY